MTCILPMTPLFTSPCVGYREETSENEIDCDWIAPSASPSENLRCSTPCRIEANSISTSSSVARFDNNMVVSHNSTKLSLEGNKPVDEAPDINKRLEEHRDSITPKCATNGSNSK